VYERIHGGSHTLAPGVTVGQGILFEVLMTFILVQTVLMVACVDQSPWHRLLTPLAVGFAVLVDITISLVDFSMRSLVLAARQRFWISLDSRAVIVVNHNVVNHNGQLLFEVVKT
jgi:hypothetical protein